MVSVEFKQLHQQSHASVHKTFEGILGFKVVSNTMSTINKEKFIWHKCSIAQMSISHRYCKHTVLSMLTTICHVYCTHKSESIYTVIPPLRYSYNYLKLQMNLSNLTFICYSILKSLSVYDIYAQLPFYQKYLTYRQV